MYRVESEQDFKTLMRQKWALVVLSVLVFITSIAIFCVCVWIRIDTDFREWVREIDWYSYWYAVYVIMVTMVVAAGTMVLLAYGAIAEVRFALGASIFLIVVLFILETVSTVLILVYGVEESDILTADLRDVFWKLIYRMDHDARASRILKIVQEYVRCCGARGAEDYIEAMKPVPVECRDPIDGGEYPYGCAQKFAWWLEPWSATLAGVCTVFIVFHIVQLVLTSKLMKSIRKYERTQDYEN